MFLLAIVTDIPKVNWFKYKESVVLVIDLDSLIQIFLLLSNIYILFTLTWKTLRYSGLFNSTIKAKLFLIKRISYKVDFAHIYTKGNLTIN